MVPSTGIEPVAFPMSRERATAAPTGRKLLVAVSIKSHIFASVGAFPKAGTNFMLQALRQLGVNYCNYLNLYFIIAYSIYVLPPGWLYLLYSI